MSKLYHSYFTPLDFWRGGNYARNSGGVVTRTGFSYFWAGRSTSGSMAVNFGSNAGGYGYVHDPGAFSRGEGFQLRCARIAIP